MSYIDKTLVPGEKVVYTTRLHWIVLVVPLADERKTAIGLVCREHP